MLALGHYATSKKVAGPIPDNIIGFFTWSNPVVEARSIVVVKTLCYKPEGRGFDTRWGDFLNVPNPSGRDLLSL
jgi:hypothetical protein